MDKMSFNFEHDAHLYSLCKPSEREGEVPTQPTYCRACIEIINDEQLAYKRGDVHDYWLHESCAKLPREIKHPLHSQHLLTLLVKPPPTASFPYHDIFICNGCREISCGYTFYCKEEGCDFKLDIKCGSLMAGYFTWYDRQTIQELHRKANTNPFNHQHALILYKVPIPYDCDVVCEYDICNCCNEKICRDFVYLCNDCESIFHESCIDKLPPEIHHQPLHSHHSLTLVYEMDESFLCNGCRYISKGFRFNCILCGFNLDLKCGLLMDEFFTKYDRRAFEEMDRKARIKRFCHKHILTLCNYKETEEDRDRVYCCYCWYYIHDSAAYICLECQFFIHESCKNEMKEQVQHPFHPQHTLRTRDVDKDTSLGCKVCHCVISEISLSCLSCNFHLHHLCARPHKRPLRHNCHEHTLFYFGNDERYGMGCRRCCRICNGYDGRSYHFKCLTCEYYFHLECIPVPPVVEAKCHDHPLTLLDSLRGSDFEEYYCDFCEEGGNTKHHLYSCEDNACPGYIAHIDCLINEDEDVWKDFFSKDTTKQHIDAEEKKVLQEAAVEKEKNDQVQEVDGVDAEESRFEQLPQTSMKGGTSKEMPSSSFSSSEIDAKQVESDAEIENICAQMEGLATKLEAIKGKRASELLLSMMSSFREKIKEL